MIQRIQTLYLSLLIILLALATFSQSFFSYLTEITRYTFNAYGVTEYSLEDSKILNQTSFPFYIGTIALCLLSFLCIMSYKNLARQFKLGRMIFFLYLVMLISVVLLSTFGNSLFNIEEASREMGMGFIYFVIGFPFSFLANLGIKRDKKLLESLDRLR